jgi:prophage antirepressor-like protein
MEVVKAFNDNNIGTQITILGTPNEPIFKANDIGIVLEMSNIRATIKDFNEELKVVKTIDTLGGKQQVTFLTEFGLYKVLFGSRKPIAEKFKKWVCEVIREIRLTGQYKLEQEKKELQDKLQEANKTIETKQEENEIIVDECERILVRNHDKQPLVYLAHVCEGEISFGFTNDIRRRRIEHRSEIGSNFKLIIVFPTSKYIQLESLIKKDDKIRKRIFSKEINGKQQTEFIRIDKPCGTFTFISLINRINHLKTIVEKDLEKENERLTDINDKLCEKVRIMKFNTDKITKQAELTITNENLKNDPVIIRDIHTGDETIITNNEQLKSVSGIHHGSLHRYLNKPLHRNGLTFRNKDKPYWKPPKNYKYDKSLKSTTHSVPCKSVCIKTGETVYYNSVTDTARILDVDRKSLTDLINRTSNYLNEKVVEYEWFSLESCGFLVYPDGKEENIESVVNNEKDKFKTVNSVIKQKVKNLLEFTESTDDKLRTLDIDILLKKYKINSTSKLLKEFLIECGAESTGNTKKIKHPNVKKTSMGYYKVKFKNDEEFKELVLNQQKELNFDKIKKQLEKFIKFTNNLEDKLCIKDLKNIIEKNKLDIKFETLRAKNAFQNWGATHSGRHTIKSELDNKHGFYYSGIKLV